MGRRDARGGGAGAGQGCQGARTLAAAHVAPAAVAALVVAVALRRAGGPGSGPRGDRRPAAPGGSAQGSPESQPGRRAPPCSARLPRGCRTQTLIGAPPGRARSRCRSASARGCVLPGRSARPSTCLATAAAAVATATVAGVAAAATAGAVGVPAAPGATVAGQLPELVLAVRKVAAVAEAALAVHPAQAQLGLGIVPAHARGRPAPASSGARWHGPMRPAGAPGGRGAAPAARGSPAGSDWARWRRSGTHSLPLKPLLGPRPSPNCSPCWDGNAPSISTQATTLRDDGRAAVVAGSGRGVAKGVRAVC